MTRLIIIYLTLILLSSCGTSFVARKYTEGCFYEHLDNTEQEMIFKDTVFVKKLKKGSTIVTRKKSEGRDIIIEVDENNIPLTKLIVDTIKLTLAEEKYKVARIKSIGRHAQISKAVFWLPVFGFFHNVSYLKKAQKIESKYKVDLSTEKQTLRTFLFLSIPFLLVGIILVLFVILSALAGVAILG